MENTKALYESPKKEENNDRYGEYGSECICCGRPMAAGMAQFVHMNEHWMAVSPEIKEENCVELTGANSQGCFPIGSECAKKMKGYTFESTLDKGHPKFKQK